jgi:hypothetical protein
MLESRELGFCKLSFYDSYMVAVINEGVNIGPRENTILTTHALNFFGNSPFVYITHRLNSYSVDPHIYPETARIKNLVGFAVVSADYKAKHNVKIERMFFNKPFEAFNTLNDAISWALQLIEDKKY